MLSRSLKKAKEAYKKRDLEASKIAHKKKIQRAPEVHNQEHGKYIKSIIYGGVDGIVTTFAVVAGVAGAELSPSIVLILGFANLIADGLAMAIGDFLSTKAENEYNKAERGREKWEVENHPEGEKEELIELYMFKGISEVDATNIVETISNYPEAWVDIMMVEELGILEDDESPTKNAIVTFFSFAIFGFIPLLSYIISKFLEIKYDTFIIASILTAITLFVLGALKVKLTEKNWLLSGLEMMIVGGIAAFSAYIIGVLLSGIA